MQLKKNEDQERIDELTQKARDEWNLKKNAPDYQDYQYWKVPGQFKIEDLIKEQETS